VVFPTALALGSWLLAAQPSNYAEVLHAELGTAIAEQLEPHRALIAGGARQGRVLVLELEIDPDGIAATLRTSRSTGDKELDDILRGWVLAADPFSIPPSHLMEQRRGATCVLRAHGHAGGGRLVSYAVACLPPDAEPIVAGWNRADEARFKDEPGALVFAGWAREAAGDYMRARLHLRRAAELAPDWALAAGAFGLSLARSDRMQEARPFLEEYAAARGVPLEIRGYLAGATVSGEAPASDTPGGEPAGSISECQRPAAEVQAFVQGRADRIDNCLQNELRLAPNAPMPPYLPIRFVVKPSGDIQGVTIDHRSFRVSRLRDCIEIALAGELEPAGGADCPGQLTMKVVTERQTPDR
jgi:tetratricopeptide (TPR) repeat protein